MAVKTTYCPDCGKVLSGKQPLKIATDHNRSCLTQRYNNTQLRGGTRWNRPVIDKPEW
jgi:hypothetical protein